MVGQEVYVVEVKRNSHSGWVACLHFEHRCFDSEQAAVDAVLHMLKMKYPSYDGCAMVPVKDTRNPLGRCWVAITKNGNKFGKWRVRGMTVETN